jgi:hypothetical protein
MERVERLSYTILELSRALGIDHTFIFNMIRKGNIWKIKVAGRSQVPADEAKRLLMREAVA